MGNGLGKKQMMKGVLRSSKFWVLIPIVVVGMLLLMTGTGIAFLPDSFVSGRSLSSGDNPDRLIPFMLGLTRIPEMIPRHGLMSMNASELTEVSYMPYHEVRDLCRSPQFALSEPGHDRYMVEVSVGTTGSTWQMQILDQIVARHKFRLETKLIPRGQLKNWTGVESVPFKENPSNAHLPLFGRLFKIHHFQEELFQGSSLMFSAIRIENLSPWKRAYIDDYSRGTCPCCFSLYDVLGKSEAEEAMIYMHAFAMGFQMSKEDVRYVRLTLAFWLKGKYCFTEDQVKTRHSCLELRKEFPEVFEVERGAGAQDSSSMIAEEERIDAEEEEMDEEETEA